MNPTNSQEFTVTTCNNCTYKPGRSGKFEVHTNGILDPWFLIIQLSPQHTSSNYVIFSGSHHGFGTSSPVPFMPPQSSTCNIKTSRLTSDPSGFVQELGALYPKIKCFSQVYRHFRQCFPWNGNHFPILVVSSCFRSKFPTYQALLRMHRWCLLLHVPGVRPPVPACTGGASYQMLLRGTERHPRCELVVWWLLVGGWSGGFGEGWGGWALGSWACIFLGGSTVIFVEFISPDLWYLCRSPKGWEARIFTVDESFPGGFHLPCSLGRFWNHTNAAFAAWRWATKMQWEGVNHLATPKCDMGDPQSSNRQ